MYTHPPDSLLNYLHSPQTPPFAPMHRPSNFLNPQQGQTSMENFHFVGVPPQLSSFSTPPPPPHTKGNPSSSRAGSAKVAPSSKGSSKREKTVANLEEDPEPPRTAQRLPWTSEEETRLVNTQITILFFLFFEIGRAHV